MTRQFPILLVEDDLDTVELIKRVAQKGFPEAVFIHVTSFNEAVGYLYNIEGLGPKLALLDINLDGDKNGLDFLTLMQQHPQGRFLPVVVLSATGTETNIKAAYRLGAASFTQKPFSLKGWQSFVTLLRMYWYETVLLPNTWFEKQNSPG
ncbi:response regulator [Spirosoma sp. SC4-14]|uniref:response regulator n=1 Tax=Spirosoma sp. SC4-14 TaxID=3128900 RepID=UPI0030D1BA65